MERLSSGFRINRAADDAAGLSMSNKLSVQVRSMNQALSNASQANSMLQIAEGGTDQIYNMLSRLKELATQAASGNSSENLDDINAEAQQLLTEIDRVADTTTFQGNSLLAGFGTRVTSATLTAVANTYDLSVKNADAATYSVSAVASTGVLTIKNTDTDVSQELTVGAGANTYNFGTLGISFKTSDAAARSLVVAALASALDGMAVTISGDATFQVGETNDTNYRIGFQLDSVKTTALSVNAIQLDSLSNAQTAMDKIDDAITALNSARADIGAIQNRLSYTSANLASSMENASAANSVIKDVDMAAEMTGFVKNQILMQAGTAMLAQANMAPQQVLSLF